jgi:MFS family permease
MRARCNYYLVVVAALLYGTATGQMTMLAPMLKQLALAPAALGLVLAAVPLGNIAGRVWSAWVVERLGARRALCLSALTAALGIAGLIPAISIPVLFIPPLAAAAAAIRGVSYSVFNTAGILAIRAHAAPDQRVYAVGLFTAMFMVPCLWAPAIGELTLTHFSMVAYLLFATMPMLLALLFAACTIDSVVNSSVKPTRYLTLLKDRRLWLPELIIFCSGMVYGFSTSVLPIFLLEAHVPVASFFTSFGIALLINRLVLLRFFQRFAPPCIAAFGLIALVASMCALLVGFDTRGAVISGMLCGLGYLLHPATVEWSLRVYPKETVRPIALINIGLGLGSVASAQIGAAMLQLGAHTLITLFCIPLILTLFPVLKLSWFAEGELNQAVSGRY